MASIVTGKTGNVISVDFSARARESAPSEIAPGSFFTQSQLNGLRHFYETGRRAGLFTRMDYEQGAQASTVRFYGKNDAQPCLKIVRSCAPRLIAGAHAPYYHHVYQNSQTRGGPVLIAQDEHFTPCIKAMRRYMASVTPQGVGQLLYYPR